MALSTTKKEIHLVTNSIILTHNDLASLIGVSEVLDKVMYDFTRLEWMDLSHNLISTIDDGFLSLSSLKSLYLHANKIMSFKEVEKLNNLDKLSIVSLHANPISKNQATYRMYCIGLLKNICKLDSVVVTKKESDNAIVAFSNKALKAKVMKMVIREEDTSIKKQEKAKEKKVADKKSEKKPTEKKEQPKKA